MTSVFSWFAKFAGYLQKPVISAIVAGAVATGIPTLALVIRNTRATGIVLRGFGVLFLACGLVLVYVKLHVPAVKVPSTWLWIPAIGIVFLLAAWLLRMQRTRAVDDRITSLRDATVERIVTLKQNHHVPKFVNLITSDGKSVAALLKSLVRRSRRGRCIVLAGLPGSGKTATLLNFAGSCQEMRSARRRPIIAMYVDLAEYAAQTTEELSLAEFIKNKFHGLDKAWDENGRDVLWVFLFDNAHEADLRWGRREQSWQRVNRFVREWSRLAPLAVVADRARPKTVQPDDVIELGGLIYADWAEFLKNEEVSDELAKDKSFQWYLRDPGTLELLAPVLANRGWTTRAEVHDALARTDNVHKMMGDAILHHLRSRLEDHSPAVNPRLLRATAIATTKFLQSRKLFAPDAPGEIRLAPIADAMGSPRTEIENNLMALAERDIHILKRVRTLDNTEYVEFAPAVAAYFYTCVLRERPDAIPVQQLLFDPHFRLTAISLLKIADDDMVDQFVRETEGWLDWAIDGLTAESTPSGKASDPEQLDELTSAPYAALSVVVDGLQYRLAVLGEELREKTTEFIKLAMRFANPSIQNGLLEVSRILGTREQAISVMRAGLSSTDGSVVFRSSAGIVNALSEGEVTDLDDADQRKLVSVIIMVGLESLTISRKRGNVPSGLRLADDAGLAAIVLYGTVFGLGGVLQLINFRHFRVHNSSYPWPQILEILAAVLVAGSVALARYEVRWRQFFLRHDFQAVMNGVSGFLAIVGSLWAAGVVINALATFSMSLMPILVCYSLVWPASALFYLVSDRCPTITSVIFPLPRVVDMLWHESRD